MSSDLGLRDTPDTEPLPPGPSPRPWHWRAVIIGAIVIIVGLVAVSVLLPRGLISTRSPNTTTGARTPASDARRIQATLFYETDDGLSLEATVRSVPLGDTPTAQARELVVAQVAAAPDGVTNPLPNGTTVEAVFLTGTGAAYVDLGGAIITARQMSAIDEALAVYAIVNVLTVNLPEITHVQILLDGKEVESLAGHIDVRAPLAKDLTWVGKGL